MVGYAMHVASLACSYFRLRRVKSYHILGLPAFKLASNSRSPMFVVVIVVIVDVHNSVKS